MKVYKVTLYCWLSRFHLSSNSVMLTCMFIQFSLFLCFLGVGFRFKGVKKGDDASKLRRRKRSLVDIHSHTQSPWAYVNLSFSSLRAHCLLRPFREHKMVKRPLEAPRTFSWRNWSKVWEARIEPHRSPLFREYCICQYLELIGENPYDNVHIKQK